MESPDRIGRTVAAILGQSSKGGVPCPMLAPCRVPIVQVRGSNVRHFVILSEDLWGEWCHYWRGRTYHCPGAEVCAFDHRSSPLQWQGWLGVSPLSAAGTWTVALTSVTQQTCRRVPALCDGTLALRGRVLSLWREGKAPPGALVGALDEVGHELPGLPPAAPDVAAEICRMSAAKILRSAPPPIPAAPEAWRERLRKEDEAARRKGKG